MSDWPLSPPQLPVQGFGQIADQMSPAAPAVANWGAANQAMYFPVRLKDYFPLRSMYVSLGSITGTKNWDIGLYDKNGTRLWSSGSFVGSSSTFTIKTLGTEMLLAPDAYYMALASDSATNNQVWRRAVPRAYMLRLVGVAQQASAFPLPAAATFATNTGVIVPLMGIASITSY